jgi:type II restriction enzyme
MKAISAELQRLKEDNVLLVLQAIDFPLGPDSEFKTELRKRRLARILLAVANVTPASSFEEMSIQGDGRNYSPRSRDILRFINQHYGENLSEGSYDDIRRANLDYLVEAGVVIRSANRPDAATNDGTRGYSIARDAKSLFTTAGNSKWPDIVKAWKLKHGSLEAKLARPRIQKMVPVKLPDGRTIELSEGKHNTLQKAIVEQFLPRFLKKPELLYFGDTAKKVLINETEALNAIGLDDFDHDMLPDVVAIDREREWLYFIEAVHSANPVSRLRHLHLERLGAKCPLGKVYVSAFHDRASFAKWVSDQSWETEVWLASDPSHMIHFNGDRFLGPHTLKAD